MLAAGQPLGGSRGEPGVVVIDDLAASCPGELFVLTVAGDTGVGLELRTTDRRDRMLVAYTSIDRLVEACGSGQPWARIATGQLEQLAHRAQVNLVAVDKPIPEGRRYPEPDSREQPELAPLDAPADEGVLYVPSRPVRPGQHGVTLELQPYRGKPTLLAYSSLDALREGCGRFQSCVSIAAERLDAVAWHVGAQRVLFNPILTEDARHTGPVLDWRN